MLFSYNVLTTATYDGNIYTNVITVNAEKSQYAIQRAASYSPYNLKWYNAKTGKEANNVDVEYFNIISYEVMQ